MTPFSPDARHTASPLFAAHETGFGQSCISGGRGPRGCPGPRGPQGPQPPLSDTLDSAARDVAASSLAVKTAYDRGTEALESALEADQSARNALETARQSERAADTASHQAALALEEALAAQELLAERRVPASGHVTLHIRTDGNDANTGLADTPEQALATFNGARDVMHRLDMRNRRLYVFFAPGIYTTPIHLNPGDFCNANTLYIGSADRNDPAVIQAADTTFLARRFPSFIQLSDMRFQATATSRSCINIWQSEVSLAGVVACEQGYNGIDAAQHSRVALLDGCQLTLGNLSNAGLDVGYGSYGLAGARTAVHFNGPHLASAGVCIHDHSRLTLLAALSGASTGRRYLLDLCSMIFTNGAGAGLIPGTLDGLSSNGSFYL